MVGGFFCPCFDLGRSLNCLVFFYFSYEYDAARKRIVLANVAQWWRGCIVSTRLGVRVPSLAFAAMVEREDGFFVTPWCRFESCRGFWLDLSGFDAWEHVW